MLNLDTVETVYIACGITDLRKSIDGLILEVDNNAAEREIKPSVIAPKNFLFANTSKGAICSTTIYSIIETAKANKLVVENYLVYLFENLVNIDLTCSESLEKLMP